MKIGLIGGRGRIAQLIWKALAENNYQDLYFSVRHPEQANEVTDQHPARVCSTPELVMTCDVIFVCVKPQDFLNFTPFSTTHSPLVISLMAGVTTARISQTFPGATIVRAMPNLGGQVGQSVTAWYAQSLTPKQEVFVKQILQALGLEIRVQTEDEININTVIYGSGPAYVYHLMQTLENIASQLGIPPTDNRAGIYALFRGALAYAEQSPLSPAELIGQVASKGGTTRAALQVLEDNHVQEIWQKAIDAALTRTRELSQ